MTRPILAMLLATAALTPSLAEAKGGGGKGDGNGHGQQQAGSEQRGQDRGRGHDKDAARGGQPQHAMQAEPRGRDRQAFRQHRDERPAPAQQWGGGDRQDRHWRSERQARHAFDGRRDEARRLAERAHEPRFERGPAKRAKAQRGQERRQARLDRSGFEHGRLADKVERRAAAGQRRPDRVRQVEPRVARWDDGKDRAKAERRWAKAAARDQRKFERAAARQERQWAKQAFADRRGRLEPFGDRDRIPGFEPRFAYRAPAFAAPLAYDTFAYAYPQSDWDYRPTVTYGPSYDDWAYQPFGHEVPAGSWSTYDDSWLPYSSYSYYDPGYLPYSRFGPTISAPYSYGPASYSPYSDFGGSSGLFGGDLLGTLLASLLPALLGGGIGDLGLGGLGGGLLGQDIGGLSYGAPLGGYGDPVGYGYSGYGVEPSYTPHDDFFAAGEAYNPEHYADPGSFVGSDYLTGADQPYAETGIFGDVLGGGGGWADAILLASLASGLFGEDSGGLGDLAGMLSPMGLGGMPLGHANLF